jgi:hypothetical protein
LRPGRAAPSHSPGGCPRRSNRAPYQYRADRARRTIRGVDQQIAKAENAVAGKAAVKRNLFVKLTGGTRIINRDLESKAAHWPRSTDEVPTSLSRVR